MLINGPKIGLRAEFKAVLLEDGKVVEETDWNSNMITDLCLTAIHSWSCQQRCFIGSGTTPPATTDTSIETLLPGSNINGADVGTPIQPAVTPIPAVAPDWGHWSMKKFRFEAGNGTGSVNEFILGTASAGIYKSISGSNAMHRHVLPATINKAANQVLDVYFKYWSYPDIIPTTGTVTIQGINYDTETSYYALDSNNRGSMFVNIGQSLVFGSYFKCWDGAPAGLTGAGPTGNYADGGYDTSRGLINSGLGFGDWKVWSGLDVMNTASGIITVLGCQTTIGYRIQTSFAATDGPNIGGGFPKTNTDIINATWRYNYGRYTP